MMKKLRFGILITLVCGSLASFGYWYFNRACTMTCSNCGDCIVQDNEDQCDQGLEAEFNYQCENSCTAFKGCNLGWANCNGDLISDGCEIEVDGLTGPDFYCGDSCKPCKLTQVCINTNNQYECIGSATPLEENLIKQFNQIHRKIVLDLINTEVKK